MHHSCSSNKLACVQRGFTIIELLVVISIMAILFAFLIPSVQTFQKESDLTTATEHVVSLIQIARTKTLSSFQDSSYGIYFDVGDSSVVLFQGSSYAERNQDEDELYSVPSSVQMQDVDFGGGSEVVFQRVTGTTSDAGTALLSLVSDSEKDMTISVSASGLVRVGTDQAPSDEERVTDTRHVHVRYLPRTIDTGSEVLVLIFSPNDSPVTHEVPFSEHMLANGLFSWNGIVQVHGEDQEMSILTHILNSAEETEFSIWRDQEKNSKDLQVSLQEDTTGYFIMYNEDGSVEQGTSIYAQEPIVQ